MRTLEAVEVPLRPLPEDASKELHHVRNRFARLLGLRRVDYPPRPVAFSVRFAAAWCGVSWRTAGHAIRALQKEDIIVEVGRFQGRGFQGRLFDAVPPDGSHGDAGYPKRRR
jgi:hypothetical protein